MLQIVIVLYKTHLEDCISFNNLYANINKLTVKHNILIVNNSPEITITPNNDIFSLYSPKNNIMLSGAYNYAINEAKRNGHEWLLLLDQDTNLTQQYIEELNTILNSDIPTNISSILPIVNQYNRNIQISPATYNPIWGTAHVKMIPTKSITNNKCIAAINSCTTLRLSAIEAIGGFPKEFPLDGLDTAYFYLLYKKGFDQMVMESIILHNLSVYDYKHNMNKKRYCSILDSELKLAKLMGWRAQLALKTRYIVRTLKQLVIPEKRAYVKLTFKTIFKTSL